MGCEASSHSSPQQRVENSAARPPFEVTPLAEFTLVGGEPALAGGIVQRVSDRAIASTPPLAHLLLSYHDLLNKNLKYATCAAACASAANWQTVTADATRDVGQFTSLAVDGSGRVHMSYSAATNSALKYIE